MLTEMLLPTVSQKKQNQKDFHPPKLKKKRQPPKKANKGLQRYLLRNLLKKRYYQI